MRLYCACLLTFLVISSCHNSLKLSEQEQKGVQDVLAFYGGECKYSKGFRTGNEGSRRYFELEVSKVPFPPEVEKISELPASNIAYLFYRNLGSEKEKYSFIKSVVIHASGKKFEQEFPVKDLETVVLKRGVVDNIVALLIQKKYDEVASLLVNKSELMSYDKQKLMGEIKRIDTEYGAITDSKPLGFRLRKIQEREILHFSMLTRHSETQINFSIDMDINSNEIFMITYGI